MNKRKNWLTVILCIAFILLMNSCGQTQNKKLRICFDIGESSDMYSGTSRQQELVEAFLRLVDDRATQGGISPDEIEVEMIPSDESLTTERSAILQRIRTEIMTGGGPDVFVCASDVRSYQTVYDDRLFPYAEKAMESDFFLPLDEYLGDLKLSPWEEMNHHVMDCGKNREGKQMLLPMGYTLPMLSFHQEDVPPRDFSGAAWDDVLAGDDPVLAEQIRWFWSLWDGLDTPRMDFHETGITYIYPEMIDFDQGTPGFTEEELLEKVKESMSAYQRLLQRETQAESLNEIMLYDTRLDGITRMYSNDLTMIPLRNQSGGTTAVIVKYCAVNRNTKRVQDAVSIVDILLSEGTWINNTGLYDYPVNQRVLIERNTNPDPSAFFTNTGLTAQSFQEFLKATDQINAARIPSRLDYTLNEMLEEIQESLRASFDPDNDYNDLVYKLRSKFIQGSISDEELAAIVHKYYAKLCRLLDES